MNYIEDSETAVRVSLMPNLRAAYPAREIVVVDQLRLICMMESGEQIGVNTSPFKPTTLELIEAFG